MRNRALRPKADCFLLAQRYNRRANENDTQGKDMIAPAQTGNWASLAHLDLESEIKRLKTEMNAMVLAHYYQESEIQDLADFVGDSLQLSRQAASTEADVIVFAGVLFMAETAKILNPSKLVLLPDLNAGCSLADGCPASPFRAFRERYADHVSITYINCSAEVKALSDIICTSSNAEKIIRQIPPDKPILFAPDQHLGRYLIKKTGREMTLWPGSCMVHELFSEKSLVQLKERYPNALVLAHPECPESVLRHADFVGSTTGILKFAIQDPAKEFIVATESGILHQMEKACPDKVFISAPGEGGCSCSECPHMKLNTLEKLYLCMRDRRPEVTLDEDLRKRALKPILRMLEMS
jgi:quinolinate synthase